jgi:gliding motility-associated-like protein
VFCPDSAMFTDGSSISQGSIGGWSWNFGDSTTSVLQNSNHTYTGPGTYPITLVVTSDSGCTSVYRDTITINPCNDAIVNGPAVPTGFTPNGDGINDILYVRGGPFSDLDFRIFNEWGNEIFRSTSQSVGWDGTYKGKPQQEGTYVYTLVGTTMDNVKFKVSGDVTLLR